MRKLYYWKLKRREIMLGERTVLMAVLNVTPDSFSDGGKYADPDRAFARAIELEEQGADIVDIGAESTRPGSARISAAEEMRRLIPVLKRLKDRLSIPVSVDTYKAEVVVDDLGAVFQRALGHFGFVGVDRDGNRQLTAQALQHRKKTTQFLGRRDTRGFGPRGFRADIDNVGALLFHFDGARKGAVGVQIFSAVREGVRRDVQHAEDRRAFAQLDLTRLQFPVIELSHLFPVSHVLGGGKGIKVSAGLPTSTAGS